MNLIKIDSLIRISILIIGILLSGGQLFYNRYILLIALVILVLIYNRGRLLKINLSNFIILIIIIIIQWIIRLGDNNLIPLFIRITNYIASLLILGVYINNNKGIYLFRNDLYLILKYISFGSIINFILANFVPAIFYPISVSDGYTVNSLLYIFNYHESVANQYNLIRPDFIFYEPGVLQIFDNIYLYLNLFIYKNKKQAFIALISILCTLSTTGMLIAFLVLVFYYFYTLRNNNFLFKILNGIIILVVILLPSFYLLSSNIEDKLYGESSGSSIAREYDFYTGIEIIKEYPILGIGFDHARYIALSGTNYYSDTQLSGESLDERPSSNGLINLFYTIGVFLGIGYLYLLYKQNIFPNRILFFLIITLSLFSESLVFTPFFLLLINSSLLKSK